MLPYAILECTYVCDGVDVLPYAILECTYVCDGVDVLPYAILECTYVCDGVDVLPYAILECTYVCDGVDGVTLGLPPDDLQAKATCEADSATVFVCSRSVLCCCSTLVLDAVLIAMEASLGKMVAKSVILWPKVSASLLAEVFSGSMTLSISSR